MRPRFDEYRRPRFDTYAPMVLYICTHDSIHLRPWFDTFATMFRYICADCSIHSCPWFDTLAPMVRWSWTCIRIAYVRYMLELRVQDWDQAADPLNYVFSTTFKSHTGLHGMDCEWSYSTNRFQRWLFNSTSEGRLKVRQYNHTGASIPPKIRKNVAQIPPPQLSSLVMQIKVGRKRVEVMYK